MAAEIRAKIKAMDDEMLKAFDDEMLKTLAAARYGDALAYTAISIKYNYARKLLRRGDIEPPIVEPEPSAADLVMIGKYAHDKLGYRVTLCVACAVPRVFTALQYCGETRGGGDDMNVCTTCGAFQNNARGLRMECSGADDKWHCVACLRCPYRDGVAAASAADAACIAACPNKNMHTYRYDG